MSTAPDLSTLPLKELLALRNAIDAEIQGRGHARTASSLAGELMERVVADAYGGQLERAGEKSSDVLLPDGRRVQVKMRSLPPDDYRHWPFSDLDFHLAVVISIDRATSAINWARELSTAEAATIAKPHAKDGWRIRMKPAMSAGRDVTAQVRAAYERLR